MRRPTILFCVQSFAAVLCSGAIAATPELRTLQTHNGENVREHKLLPITDNRVISTTQLVPFPNGPVTRFLNGQQVDGGVAGPVGDIVYSNIGEPQAYPLNVNELVADDIRTVCAGSNMTYFEIKVAGPAGAVLNYGLYNGCPSSGGLPLPGLQFQATLVNGVNILGTDFPTPITIPGSFWLALQTASPGVTWAFGGAPEVGTSEERFDQIPFGCNTSFGGCPPDGPACANGYALIRGVECTEVFLAYRADILSAFFTPLTLDEQFADDILPITSPGTCDLAQYRADLAGLDGLYTMKFEIYSDDDVNLRPLAPVMGTIGMCSGVGNGIVDECMFEFQPIIPIPTAKLWLTYDVDGNQAGPALVGNAPQIGMSGDCFSIFGEPDPDIWSECIWWFGGCPQSMGTAPCGTFQNRFYCAGTEPTVACCDLSVSVETPCADEVPITQCFSRFVANTTCAEAEFDPPCGMASCCLQDETCQNMFQQECVDAGGLWQPGFFCEVGNQFCPPQACIVATNKCDVVNFDAPGCNDFLCCDLVCEIDNFCCTAAWDDTCVNLGNLNCPLPPPDECEIAAEGECNGTIVMDNTFATDRLTDPGFGCHNGGSDQNGIGSVWGKFTATHSSARLSTCNSPPPADDSLVAIYTGTCGSLTEIGCSDDVNGCASTNFNSDFCINGLTVGQTYYVQVAAWTEADRGRYELKVDCPASCGAPANDVCSAAEAIGNGITPYTTAGATTDGPALPGSCNEGDGIVFNSDVWYDYTAPETGTATADLCTGTGYDSRIAVYQGCTCPVTTQGTLACNDDFCDLNGASRAVFNIVEGQCYKIRVGGQNDDTGTGLLVMSSEGTGTGPNCPGGTATFTNPMNNTVDARQPNPVGSLTPAQGIQTLTVTAPSGADAECFTLCETASSGTPNTITNVMANGNTYTLTLARPITRGAVTRIAYNPEFGTGSTGTFISHPGNVNGDTTAAPTDILAIIDCINNVNPMTQCPWGIYSQDIDQSGVLGAPDILRTIDLLNGADVFDVWNNTPRPSATCTPPPPGP